MEGSFRLMVCFTYLLSIFLSSTAVDNIQANQTIRDGETIVSAGGFFELGFFSPSNSSQNRYLGIWYKKFASGTVAWVANREIPEVSTSGFLTLEPGGILVLYNATNGMVWSTNSSGFAKRPVARLLDTGNLVITDQSDTNQEKIIWQSFDYPADTFLPGMKLGKDLVRNLDWSYTSWKSEDDPSPGDYKSWMDTNGYPQVYRREGSVIKSRLGPWNGLRFAGMPSLKPNPIYTFEFVLNDQEVYYEYHLKNTSVVSRSTLTPEGNFERFSWIDSTHTWFLYSDPAADACSSYALCGESGVCNIQNSPACGCLRGFEPRNQEEWNVGDTSSGCQRKLELDCGSEEGFRKYSSLKWPDTRNSRYNKSMTLGECEKVCKKNCTCTAYSVLNVSDGSGCLLWFGELIDMRVFLENGEDIYIRMSGAELAKDRSLRKHRRVRIIIISLTVFLAILLGLCIILVHKRAKLKQKALIWLRTQGQDSGEDHSRGNKKHDLDLPLFSLPTLLTATNKFSSNNKIGEGGYGPVYKGLLENGREIAVKRLSETSTQGLEEFKNEVICISKLQHRNLVKLLGCCIDGEEKLLVYEFMPNKGLDSFIFDETKNRVLDWPTRYKIINGIARGLIYLHQDSRLRIIHRDLKAGNILLDSEMNPKISDFGMARSFGGNESETNTKRVVGTYGYMSPEYAGDGIFSPKSDVFSFGVLVLEIVSGKKNRGFVHQGHDHNLLGHAWNLYKEGLSLELVDASLIDTSSVFEMVRSIHVGLLCVQQCPEDRPDMSAVIMMLSSEKEIPQPKQPGFYSESSKFGPECSSSMEAQTSGNNFTITAVEAR